MNFSYFKNGVSKEEVYRVFMMFFGRYGLSEKSFVFSCEKNIYVVLCLWKYFDLTDHVPVYSDRDKSIVSHFKVILTETGKSVLRFKEL